MKSICCACFFLLISIHAMADKADSLKNLLNKTPDPYKKVMTLLELSDLYEFSDPSASKKYVQDGIQVSQHNSDKEKDYRFTRLEAICYYNLGVLERHTSNYKASLGYYEKSIQVYDALTKVFPDSLNKIKTDKANVLNAIGNLHFLNQNYANAISFLNEALAVYEDKKDTTKIAGTVMNIGAVLESSGQLKEALAKYQLSLRLYQLKKQRRLIAICLNNMGNIFKKLAQYKQADSVYHLSLQTRGEMNDIKGASIVLNNLADLRLQEGNYKEVIVFGKQSLQKAKEVGNLETMRHTYENISKAYARMGQYRDAYDSQVLLSQLSDSILGIEKQKALLEFQQKYETVVKENENITLREKLVKRKFYTAILIIGFVAAISILALMLFISRSRNKALKQKQELLAKEQQLSDLELRQQKELMELRSKELSSITLHMINKNETLNSLKERLDEVKKTGNISMIASVMHSIDSNFQFDDEWQRFKLHFEAVNNNFFDKLNNTYPNLTPYEIKLCVYLKIGLTSKEISQMLNTSVDAVSKARQRLRKKLNIESETDLAMYFQGF